MNDRSQTQASFWDVETTGRTDSAGGDGKSTSEMGRLSMYLVAGWDFVGEKTNGNAGHLVHACRRRAIRGSCGNLPPAISTRMAG